MDNLERVELITCNLDTETAVYRVFDPQLKREMCLKCIGYASLEAAAKGISEANTQLRFKSPYVCQIHDFQLKEKEDKCELEIEMELLDHDGREAINLRKGQPWSEEKLLEMLRKLVSALAQGQRNSLSHRDIKTANILFGQENEVKLADFGNAKWVQGKTLAAQTFAGTLGYLSPLLLDFYYQFMRNPENKHLQHNVYKSDVYALGVTFLCFAKLLRNPPSPPFTSLLQTLTDYPRLAPLLTQMTEAEESNRPDFLELEQALGSAPAVDQLAVERPLDIDIKKTIRPAPILQAPVPLCCQCGNLPDSTDWQSELSPEVKQWYAQVLGSLCSLQCLERYSQQFMMIPQRCLISPDHSFLKDMGWKQDSEVTGSYYAYLLKSICSKACWDRTLAGLQSGELTACIYCKNIMLVTNALPRLECGHCFCSSDCLGAFLQDATQRFTVKVSLICPQDRTAISPQHVSLLLKTYLTNADLGIYSWYCMYDLVQEGLYRLPCGLHYCCRECLKHFIANGRICYYCGT
jgi:serine/threonine protein kinase